MATVEAYDAVRVEGEDGEREDLAVGGSERGEAEVHEAGSPGLDGREKAAQSTGKALKNSKHKRRRERRGEEEAKGEGEDEGDDDDGVSSATGSAETESKTGSDEEEQDEPFPSLERPPSVPTEMEAPEQILVEANRQSEKGDRKPKTKIDVEDDEKLLRAVIAHEAQLTDENTPKRPVWESIAAACGDRFASGASAAGKMVWLTQVFRDQRHHQHDRLSDAMKEMLKTYMAFMGEDDSPRAIPKKKTKLSFTNPASRRRAKLREQRRLRELSQQDAETEGHDEGATGGQGTTGMAEPVDQTVEQEDGDEDSGVVAEGEEGVDEPEAEPARRVLKAAGKQVLDVAQEMQFLKAAVKHIPAFEAAKFKSEVWEVIARDAGSRYVTGMSARVHALWLMKIKDDPEEREHAKITPKMRTMLEQLENVCFTTRWQRREKKSEAQDSVAKPDTPTRKAKQKAKGIESAQKKAKKRRHQQISSEADGDNSMEIFPPLPVVIGKMSIDSELEEKLLVRVMKYIPAFEATELKSYVWEHVAQGLRGRYKNGNSARSHYFHLLRVLKNPNEREHAKLTPRMREMLAEIGRVGFRIYAPSDAPAEEPSRSRKKQRQVTETEDNEQRDAEPSHRETKPKNVRKSAAMDVDPERDGALMKVLLKHRPFDVEPYHERPAAWIALLKALNHPRLTTSNLASARAYWLRTVLSNPEHEQHKNFTPTLRKLVAKFIDALEKSPFNKKAKNRSASASTADDQNQDNSDTASSISEPVTRSRRRTRDESPAPSVSAQKRARREQDTQVEAASDEEVTAVPTTFEDHVLLLEILRDPPFLAKKKGGCNPRWELVSEAVQRQIGSKAVLVTGEACMRRMVKLLSAVRNPDGRMTVTVPSAQLEILTLIQTLTEFKSTWASIEKKQTERYLSLKDQIAAMLSRPLPKRDVSQKISNTAVVATTPSVHEEEAKESEVGEEVEEVEAEDTGEEDVTFGVQQQHVPDAEDVGSLFPLLHPSVAELLRQQEPVPLGDNSSIAAKTKALEESVATCRAEIAVQGSRLEKGRRHHHQELLAMFELLKQEHETRTAETAAMLERIEMERLERRDEFANMINLVLQVLPPL